MQFANNLYGTTILSTINKSFLPFFTTKQAIKLTQICNEFKNTVMEYRWNDSETQVKAGKLQDYLNYFPNTKAVNIVGMTDKASVEVARYLKNNLITTVKIKCYPRITDFAIQNLEGIRIHTLDLDFCNKITDAAFVHLRGIHTLTMSSCSHITDAAFVHLRGIHTLNLWYNKIAFGAFIPLRITDAAFVHLSGIHTLNMTWCEQITDAAFVHLRGIHTLNMRCCKLITDAAFIHLRGIHTLNMERCQITDAAFIHLRGIHTLDMNNCYQITDEALENLRGIHTLSARECYLITDTAKNMLRQNGTTVLE